MGAWANGQIFSENFFTPVVYVPNDQRVMGIILRYVCWGTYQPLLGSLVPDLPTHLSPPPPSDPQKFSHPVGVQNSKRPPPLTCCRWQHATTSR